MKRSAGGASKSAKYHFPHHSPEEAYIIRGACGAFAAPRGFPSKPYFSPNAKKIYGAGYLHYHLLCNIVIASFSSSFGETLFFTPLSWLLHTVRHIDNYIQSASLSSSTYCILE